MRGQGLQLPTIQTAFEGADSSNVIGLRETQQRNDTVVPSGHGPIE